MAPLFLQQANANNQHLLCGEVSVSLYFCPLPGQLQWCLAQPLGGLEVDIATWGITELSKNLNLAFAPAAVVEGFLVSVSCGGNKQS